jgi:hypothetical protein
VAGEPESRIAFASFSVTFNILTLLPRLRSVAGGLSKQAGFIPAEPGDDLNDTLGFSSARAARGE